MPARALLSTVTAGVLLAGVVWINYQRYQSTWGAGARPSRFENRVRAFGIAACVALYGAALLAFRLQPIEWVHAHPRVLIAAFTVPTFGTIGFAGVPGFWHWVAARLNQDSAAR